MADAPITTTKVAVGEYEFQLNASGDKSKPPSCSCTVPDRARPASRTGKRC